MLAITSQVRRRLVLLVGLTTCPVTCVEWRGTRPGGMNEVRDSSAPASVSDVSEVSTGFNDSSSGAGEWGLDGVCGLDGSYGPSIEVIEVLPSSLRAHIVGVSQRTALALRHHASSSLHHHADAATALGAAERPGQHPVACRTGEYGRHEQP